jgi:hypothetical protein
MFRRIEELNCGEQATAADEHSAKLRREISFEE